MTEPNDEIPLKDPDPSSPPPQQQYVPPMSPVALNYQTSAPAPGTIAPPRNVDWCVIVAWIALALGIGNTLNSFGNMAKGGPNPPPGQLSPIQWVAAIGGCFSGIAAMTVAIYMLVWVYKVHTEVQQFTGGQYPISPGKALGFCFIPFFNIYWYVNMPYRLGEFLQYHLGEQRLAASTIMTLTILAIVPGSCINGLQTLFMALAMQKLQRGLNTLWSERAGYPAV